MIKVVFNKILHIKFISKYIYSGIVYNLHINIPLKQNNCSNVYIDKRINKSHVLHKYNSIYYIVIIFILFFHFI